MMNLTIKEIADACGGELVLQECEGSESKVVCCDSYVTSVVLDSRKVEDGGVFVATVGERVDGHKFVTDVFSKGVAVALVQKTPKQVEAEQGVPANWGSYILVEDTLQALKEIAEYYRTKLSAKIVGITGSVGKTSTKEFIAGVLAEKYNVLKTEGNFNNEIGVPLTLLRIRDKHEVAVVEMGISDFGEMHRLSKMAKPDVCVITNIGQCHLENLKTRDGILQAKSEIFDFMAEDGEICLNGEDDKLIQVKEVEGRKPHFFGLGGNEAQEVFATDIVSRGLWGSDAVLVRKMTGEHGAAWNNDGVAKASRFSVQVPLPGAHMVLNAAAATCVAGLFGLTEKEIAAGISKIIPVSGRNNLIRLPQYTLIDDCYNANPASMKAAIDLLAMADTEKVAILGDMFELGENASALHAEVGNYAANAGINRILCVGEESRHMYEAAKAAVEGMDTKKKPEILHFPTRERLLHALASRSDDLVPEGCTVLIKASHGMKFSEVLDFLQEA